MNYKFIYCYDEEIKDQLSNKLELVNECIIDNKKTWIFENDNKMNFNNYDSNKIKLTNKFFI